MTGEPVDTFYISDTEDGHVALSRTPIESSSQEPAQLLLIAGKENVVPPKMLLTRAEFKDWRYQLEDEGCVVELQFAN